MLRKILITSFFLLSILTIKSFLSPSFPSPLPKILPEKVNVSAQVGTYYLEILSGWASPWAEITLTAPNLVRKTISDEKGFFAFQNILLPSQKGELCLISQDQQHLPSFPVCLPPPPANQDLKIQDVLLPPTLSVENDKIFAGKTAKASGMTFPNSEVDVYLFTESHYSLWSRITSIAFRLPIPKLLTQNSNLKTQNQNSKLKTINSFSSKFLKLDFDFELAKSAYALGLPKYRIKSNHNGYFEFSLPASFPSTNAVFATAFLNHPNLQPITNNRSPKSNTLYFQTIGLLGLLKILFENLLKKIATLGNSLVQYKTFLIILGEILILLTLLALTLSKKNKNSDNYNKSLPNTIRNN